MKSSYLTALATLLGRQNPERETTPGERSYRKMIAAKADRAMNEPAPPIGAPDPDAICRARAAGRNRHQKK